MNLEAASAMFSNSGVVRMRGAIVDNDQFLRTNRLAHHRGNGSAQLVGPVTRRDDHRARWIRHTGRTSSIWLLQLIPIRDQNRGFFPLTCRGALLILRVNHQVGARPERGGREGE